jgi:hypothetical protein
MLSIAEYGQHGKVTLHDLHSLLLEGNPAHKLPGDVLYRKLRKLGEPPQAVKSIFDRSLSNQTPPATPAAARPPQQPSMPPPFPPMPPPQPGTQPQKSMPAAVRAGYVASANSPLASTRGWCCWCNTINWRGRSYPTAAAANTKDDAASATAGATKQHYDAADPKCAA